MVNYHHQDQTATYLPSYAIQICEDAVLHSKKKLETELKNYSDLLSVSTSTNNMNFSHQLKMIPCTAEESLAYRCVCTFQIMTNSELESVESADTEYNNGNNSDDYQQGDYAYTMWEGGRPVSIQSTVFPIALPNIQNAMKFVIKEINMMRKSSSEIEADDYVWKETRKSLKSIGYASSWDQKDLYVSFYYDKAFDEPTWTKEMKELLDLYNNNRNNSSMDKVLWRIKGMIGRSKGVKYCVLACKNEDYNNDDASSNNNHVGPTLEDTIMINNQVIRYTKPLDAFQHPNGCVMMKAIRWICDKIKQITFQYNGNRRRPTMLELYSGCGAHTAVLAKLDILDKLVSVEIDGRLVQAARSNATANSSSTEVLVWQGDAADFSQRINAKKSSWQYREFDILLVDPPRQGIDQHVRHLAIHGSFTDMIYISCGKNALIRDLSLLKESYEILEVVLVDLFPRTNEIESLVHLRRRETMN